MPGLRHASDRVGAVALDDRADAADRAEGRADQRHDAHQHVAAGACDAGELRDRVGRPVEGVRERAAEADDGVKLVTPEL